MVSANNSLKAIAFFFILSFFIQQLGKVIILADYYTNQSKYAKNCINKSRPKLHCNGKCQMMKKIQEEESKQKDASEKKVVNKHEPLIILADDLTTLNAIIKSINKKEYFSLTSSNPIYRSYIIFHPPKV